MPLAFVTTFVVMPVPVLAMETDAWGITAPEGSVTVPVRFAPTVWACIEMETNSKNSRAVVIMQPTAIFSEILRVRFSILTSSLSESYDYRSGSTPGALRRRGFLNGGDGCPLDSKRRFYFACEMSESVQKRFTLFVRTSLCPLEDFHRLRIPSHESKFLNINFGSIIE